MRASTRESTTGPAMTPMAPNAGIPPNTPTNTARAEILRPARNQDGPHDIVQTAQRRAPRQHKYAPTPAPFKEQPDHRRNPHQSRSAHGQQGEQRRQHAEYHRRGQTGNCEADADEQSLKQCRHCGADDDGAGDRAQLSEQPLLAIFVHRDQAPRARDHGVAVAQKKEQQKQHDRESQQRTERAQEK